MKLTKKQISGITYFSIDNLSIELDTAKRYSINLWSEGTQKQGAFSKTLYFDDTLEEWRMRDHNCENKNKSLDFSVVIEENTLKSLETLKAYGVDNGGIAIFSEVYFELHEIGSGGKNTPREGEITRVYQLNGSLVFERYKQPTLTYNPFNNLPVGLVLLGANGNFDPNVDLGGVWLMLPDGRYIKSCDNVQTSAGVYLPASLPPVYGSGVWERNGKYGSGTSIVDGGFRIVGNYAITGPSSQNGTTCPVVAFDAGWNTNYVNNPYREHGRAGEDGLVDVAHFTCMVWVKQANQQAKQEQIDLILKEWDNQIEKCNKQITQAKAILSTNTQKMSMKKDMTDEEKLVIEKENELQNKIVENRNLYIEKINKKIEIFKKLNLTNKTSEKLKKIK